jgi:hypothetical protein
MEWRQRHTMVPIYTFYSNNRLVKKSFNTKMYTKILVLVCSKIIQKLLFQSLKFSVNHLFLKASLQ